LEQVVERDNMVRAYRRVKRNRGAAGIDGMTVAELHGFLQSNWPVIKAQLLSGIYIPQPVRRVEIPKPGGGTRLLGVPTVLDRLIQQAILQILSPLFDPGFSEHSYGFRPGRSAQQAVLQARSYQRAGKRWVVDMDLEKFFDEVNHDILMARVGRRVKDRKLLHLIRLYEGHPTGRPAVAAAVEYSSR
jgi:group II intron reverse transcriptase/maturase